MWPPRAATSAAPLPSASANKLVCSCPPRHRHWFRSCSRFSRRDSIMAIARQDASWRATSCPRSPQSGLYVTCDVRLHAPTWVVIFFHPPPYDWRYMYLFFLFPFMFHKCCYFFFFSSFSFYLLYVWSFLDNFYMKIVLKNYTKTCA